MKACKCGSEKFHKVGRVKVVEHGDFSNIGKWETELVEVVWDEYELYSYICGKCGSFFNDEGNAMSNSIMHHQV